MLHLGSPHCRPNHPGVAAEGCRYDLHLLHRNCPAALMDGLPHRIEQPGPETCHTAAENDPIRAEDRDQIGDAYAQRSASAAQTLACNRVAGLCRPQDRLRRDAIEVVLDKLADACRTPMHDRPYA